MRKETYNLLAFTLLMALFTVSCEKEETISSPESKKEAERTVALHEYNTYFLNTSVEKGYGWTGGDLNTCTPGTISTDALTMALTRINYFRRCVGLNDNVVFDPFKNKKCQQAALMLNSNNALNHYPPETWTCWTEEASEACRSSNLAMGYSITGTIEGYIRDGGAGNKAVGHRRWILFSKAKTMGIGHTSSYNALWVISSSNNTLPASMPEFIPWPPEGFVPAPLVYDRWSFSIPSADFSGTQVAMTDYVGNSVPLTVISRADNGYGDNTIVWEPSSIDKTEEHDVTYHVSIENVGIGQESANYTYEVTIFQP
jgi:hypothetical protein